MQPATSAKAPACGKLADAAGDAPRRVAVLRALQLGDLLCAVPALRALRRALPDSRITLIGLPWAAAFASRFAHLVDDFLAFPGFPGLPETVPDLAALPDFLAAVHAARFDAVIQLHGRGDVTNPLATAFKAPVHAGFVARGAWCADPARHAAWPETGHEIVRLLSLIDFLGIARAGTALEFPLSAEERERAMRLRTAHGLVPGGYVCVHPGARLASRRWPVERFAAVARRVAALGSRVVVTGNADEAALAARVAQGIPGAVNVAGDTSLGELGALVAGARLVLCNDTGVSHVAAALRTPSVVVSCGADPWRFAPLDRSRHDVLHERMACRPCHHDHCPVGHPCALAIDVERVAGHVLARLADAPAAPRAVATR
jgi:ADP-heptose:LPS heptosyltransferase